jgi:hypothetical protein
LEPIDVKKVPKMGFHLNGVTYDYGETFHKNFILHYVNRHLYPVVLLKTEEDIYNFINTGKDWVENTPFYQNGYLGFEDYFTQFRKVTRVIAFVKDKVENKEELQLIKTAALNLASREDLRIAKVTNPSLVSEFKTKYNIEWFHDSSSNSMVMFKKDANRPEKIVKFFDLNSETEVFTDLITSNSIEPLEELSGSAFKIITYMKKPMFIAYLSRNHSEYGTDSVALFHVLEKVALRYPQYTFTYTEEERYKDTKKGNFGFCNV